MSRSFKALAIASAITVIGAASVIGAKTGGFSFGAQLTGYQETPSAVSTTGNGFFRATVSDDGNSITYELTYADLEGAVQQAHLHFGQSAVTGPISIFMCTNLGNGPVGTQACPAPPSTVTGTWTVDDLTNLSNERGISAGEWDEFVNAIRSGVVYANVHSTRWPGGEIRGQLGVLKK